MTNKDVIGNIIRFLPSDIIKNMLNTNDYLTTYFIKTILKNYPFIYLPKCDISEKDILLLTKNLDVDNYIICLYMCRTGKYLSIFKKIMNTVDLRRDNNRCLRNACIGNYSKFVVRILSGWKPVLDFGDGDNFVFVDPRLWNYYCFILSCRQGYYQIVKILLDWKIVNNGITIKIDPTYNNNFGLWLACANNNTLIVKKLLNIPSVKHTYITNISHLKLK